MSCTPAPIRNRACITSLLVVVGATAVAGAGCSPQITRIGTRSRVVHLRVVSREPGALVRYNGTPVGRTPTTLTLRYQVHHEELLLTDHIGGAAGAILGAGPVGLLGYLFYMIGTEGLFDDPEPTAAVYGVALMAGSVAMVGAAIYLLATMKQRRKRSVPSSAKIEIERHGSARLRKYVSLDSSTPRHQTVSFASFGARRALEPVPRRPALDTGDEPALTPLLRMRQVPLSDHGGAAGGPRCVDALLRVCARRSDRSLPASALGSLLSTLAYELAKAQLRATVAGTLIELAARKTNDGSCALSFWLRPPGEPKRRPYGTMRSGCDASDLLRNLRAAARGIARTLAAKRG